MLTGTDEDPNTCQFCNKTFNRPVELAIHYQQNHPDLIGEDKNNN